jgi:hypothetical protein
MCQFVVVVILFCQTDRGVPVQHTSIINIQLLYPKGGELQGGLIFHNGWIKLLVMPVDLALNLVLRVLYLLFAGCCAFQLKCRQFRLMLLKRGFKVVHLLLNRGYRCFGVIVNALLVNLLSHLNSWMMWLHFLNLLLIHRYLWWNILV